MKLKEGDIIDRNEARMELGWDADEETENVSPEEKVEKLISQIRTLRKELQNA